MACTVTREDILRIQADAAVLPLEMTGRPTEGLAARRLTEAGGAALEAGLHRLKFLPVGSAALLDGCGLPFERLIVTPVPRWRTGKANELMILGRCYESVFALAAEQGLETLALPFLSACYYRFPAAEAVHVALHEAARWKGRAIFAADTEELFALSQKPWRKPQIVSYIGYYRDHAIFALDNGLYARVDLRPELRQADVIPFFEACFREGNNPLQPPLPPEEIARLRRIWEELDM